LAEAEDRRRALEQEEKQLKAEALKVTYDLVAHIFHF
jgi:hypothetical protein